MASDEQSEETLQEQIQEINSQLAEMIGSADVSIGGLSANESGLRKELERQRASLEWRLKAVQDGSSSSSTLRAGRLGGGY